MEKTVAGKTARETFNDAPAAVLAEAACDGDLPGIARALREGANVNSRGLFDSSPLFWAVTCKNSAGIEALLRAGANANDEMRISAGYKISPVFTAAGNRETNILKLLLKYGGDPNVNDGGSNSALVRAFSLGVELSRGDEHDRSAWDNYYTLLNADANINRDDGTLPIAMAAGSVNEWDKVAELLDRGYHLRLSDLANIAAQTNQDVMSPYQRGWLEAVKRKLEQIRAASPR
jgi:hypothetical protein